MQCPFVGSIIGLFIPALIMHVTVPKSLFILAATVSSSVLVAMSVRKHDYMNQPVLQEQSKYTLTLPVLFRDNLVLSRSLGSKGDTNSFYMFNTKKEG